MGYHISYAFHKYGSNGELGGEGGPGKTSIPLRIRHYRNVTFKNIVSNPPLVE